MSPVAIAVAGAGLIGRRHIAEVRKSPVATLAAVVDPAPTGDFGVPVHPTLADLFAAGGPDGVILATPNQLHVQGGLECVEAGVPVLVEKPVGSTVKEAAVLVEAAEAANVPLLTGHHRRYSPIMAKAREVVSSGVLGPIVAVLGSAITTSRTTTSTSAAGGGGCRAAARSC